MCISIQYNVELEPNPYEFLVCIYIEHESHLESGFIVDDPDSL